MAKRNSSKRPAYKRSSDSEDKTSQGSRRPHAGKRPRNTRGESSFDSKKPSRRTSQKSDQGQSSSRPGRKFSSKPTPGKRRNRTFEEPAQGEKTPTRPSRNPFKSRSDDSGQQPISQRPATRSKWSGNKGDESYRRPSSKKYAGKQGSFKGKSSERKSPPELQAPAQTGQIRLNKYIANSGVCSRREADELIKLGVISVNGKTITELGYKVNPGDVVRHESKILRAEKPVYILLNKPKGFLTTTSDPQERNTVMHLIGNHVKERVYPVGRLDRNTTGLLLLTNDGDLADKLMHPSYNVKKIYRVELDRPLTRSDAQLILDGVQLEEGRAIVDDLAIISEDKRTIGIEIHIGWNRVVRRIFEALNYEVLKLDRSVYAGLDKKDLGRGEWRFLTKEELVRLKHYQ